MRWMQLAECREQLVLFPTKLDDLISPDHTVRIIDSLLGRLDWQPLEATYHPRLGQPPIHPRILCGVIIYGLLCRIRSSRKLEEALVVRVDFRWLAHGLSIDHTTISEFRRKHPEELRNLFVQIVLIGQEMGLVEFKRIGFDGTRIRSNNRKSGTRTPEQLRKLKQELQEQFDRLSEKADAEDVQDEEAFGDQSDSSGDDGESQRRKLEQAQATVDAALAELEKIDDSPETTPSRLPITDPESRFSKTKEGSFAPSYTPTATVDIDSGMIVDEDVIPQSNESGELTETIQQVQSDYDLSGPVGEVLADGLMATGENCAACEAMGVDLISPVRGAHQGENPAVRDDLRQPVAAEMLDALPVKTIDKQTRFDKQAFVYAPDSNTYWCPSGKPLEHSSRYTTTSAGKQLTRDRYRASKQDCGSCTLAPRCLRGKTKFRQIDRGEHEDAIDRQVEKMNRPESAKRYSARRSAGERPFAVIKQVFGARQFLTRGLSSVRQEWRWLSIAFDLNVLVGHVRLKGQPP
ncbi:MAG: IS1182 family transposase [Bythopirellula sp.]